jgi:hypothetical protein
MRRESHVRFWEGVGVRFPRATRLSQSIANFKIRLGANRGGFGQGLIGGYLVPCPLVGKTPISVSRIARGFGAGRVCPTSNR